jgi:dolichyl-phosphate-mannose-protein mannosyltransferase
MKAPKWINEKRFVLALFLFNLGFYLFRIWEPVFTYFDEKPFYINAARAYLTGSHDPNPEHPPLAKLIMATGIKIFGDNPFGWRGLGVLLAALAVVTTYFLAKRLTGSKRIGAIAALLLTFDFGWFVSARVATLEVYLVSFLVFASFFAVRLFQEKKLWNLVPLGLFLGASFATKWTGALLIFWICLFLLVFWKEKLLVKIASFVFIGALVALVYLASYLPYLGRHTWTDLVSLHKWMVAYHTSFIPYLQNKYFEKHPNTEFYAYPSWAWIFDPTFTYLAEYKEKVWTKTILFLYNPIVLWGGFFSAGYLFIQQFRKMNKLYVFLVGSFLALYLPWFASPRFAITYYLVAGLPFLAICFGIVLNKYWQKRPTVVLGVLLAFVSAFIIYYPMLSFMKVPYLYSRVITGVIGFTEAPVK